MKTLLALLLLAVASHGQTLKWEVEIPEPSFSYDNNYESGKTDTIGTTALSITYVTQGSSVGSQVVWYSSTGKLIKADSFTGTTSIAFVTPTVLIVHVLDGASSYLRKYTRRGVTITSKDTPLSGPAEYVFSSGVVEINDKFGFFVLKHSEDFRKLLSVKRYLR